MRTSAERGLCASPQPTHVFELLYSLRPDVDFGVDTADCSEGAPSLDKTWFSDCQERRFCLGLNRRLSWLKLHTLSAELMSVHAESSY